MLYDDVERDGCAATPCHNHWLQNAVVTRQEVAGLCKRRAIAVMLHENVSVS